MRFDGYYLYSDLLRMPNLEYRAFEMGRWWIREKLFAAGETPAEPARLHLVVYAICTWIYRFFLFLGIALLIYHFFFKAAGIILMAIDVIYFIARPVYREIMRWRKLHESGVLSWNRATLRSVLMLGLLLAMIAVPWKSSVSLPALLDTPYSMLYASQSGQLAQLLVRAGDKVEQGQLLAVIQSPQLEHELEQAQRRYEELGWQRASMGFNPDLLQQSLVVAAELQTQNERLRGLLETRERLQVKAAISGIVTDMNTDLSEGIWVSAGEPLLAVKDQQTLRIAAYVREQDLGRVSVTTGGRFYPEEPGWGTMEAAVSRLDEVGVRELDKLYLASLFGGDIPVREGRNQELITQESYYVMMLEPQGATIMPDRVLRGSVVVEGEARSMLSGMVQRILQVFQQESGF